MKIFKRILKKCEELSKQISIENERNMVLQEELERATNEVKRALGWNRSSEALISLHENHCNTYKDLDTKRERLHTISGVYMSLSHIIDYTLTVETMDISRTHA